jgi:hypothetical protein
VVILFSGAIKKSPGAAVRLHAHDFELACLTGGGEAFVLLWLLEYTQGLKFVILFNCKLEASACMHKLGNSEHVLICVSILMEEKEDLPLHTYGTAFTM